jgi:hypothetical protein
MALAITTLGPGVGSTVVAQALAAYDHIRQMGLYVTERWAAGDQPDFATDGRPVYDGEGDIEVAAPSNSGRMIVTVTGDETFILILNTIFAAILGHRSAQGSGAHFDPCRIVAYLDCGLPEISTTFYTRGEDA